MGWRGGAGEGVNGDAGCHKLGLLLDLMLAVQWCAACGDKVEIIGTEGSRKEWQNSKKGKMQVVVKLLYLGIEKLCL